MYLAYKPPQMLPTQTLNPTTSATGGAKSTGKAKRGFADGPIVGEELPYINNLVKRQEPIDADRWWWFGVGMTALGGIGYFCF